MSGGDSWIAVGRIRRPHGVRGEVVVDVETDFPERLAVGTTVGLGSGDVGERRLVETLRWHKGSWLMRLSGVASREDAEELREHWLFLPVQPREVLPENYYYDFELMGARVVREPGELLGEVVGVSRGPGGGLLTVRRPGSDETALVPFVSPIVVRVDEEAGEIVVDPPAGLLDGDAL